MVCEKLDSATKRPSNELGYGYYCYSKGKNQCYNTMKQPKMERLDFSEGSQQFREGLQYEGIVSQKEGNDVDISNKSTHGKKHVSTKNINKVEKYLELKHEMWKLNKVQLKQLEDKKRKL
jgi:hypothetical protein